MLPKLLKSQNKYRMPLPRKIVMIDADSKVEYNIYDISNKEIVFRGDCQDCANYLGISAGSLRQAAIRKNKVKKKYAVRVAKTIK